VPRIDHIDQPWAKKVILFRWARAVLHGRTEIAGFSLELYKSLQLEARKTRLIQHKINEMAVVQCERVNTASWIDLTTLGRSLSGSYSGGRPFHRAFALVALVAVSGSR
jgi:hypothetical protein